MSVFTFINVLESWLFETGSLYYVHSMKSTCLSARIQFMHYHANSTMEPCSLCSTSRAHTVCHQEPTSPLPFDKHIETPQSARAEIQDGLCARLQNQAQFYYGNHTNCNFNSQTASPQSQNQTSTLNWHGNKHETPKPLNKRQAVLWVSCIS